jgi:uncharacterized protein with NAD-binding domain and iron-sulfur cluster
MAQAGGFVEVNDPSRPIRVAVIGGGAAAVTAAFELTRPEHNSRYQVTVYQAGWRLGGKGASGRGAAGRIEEHGLHIWFGCYENAFQIMRQCYAELGDDALTCPFRDWKDAFVAASRVGHADLLPGGKWLTHTADFSPAEGLPGDPLEPNNPFSVSSYLARTVALIRTMLRDIETRTADQKQTRVYRTTLHEGQGAGSLDDLVGTIADLLRGGIMMTTAALVQSLALLEAGLRQLAGEGPGALLQPLLQLLHALRDPLTDLAFADADRFIAEFIDIMVAILVGCLRFGLVTSPSGFDAIDNYELRAWLRLNGAEERSLHGGFMGALYDLSFAYEDGDPNRPSIAAGQGLRGFFRIFFGHRGPFAWKMRAGMGDVMFAPLYRLLSRRGVSFEFFHRLENVGITASAADSPHVSSLEFLVQAETADGSEYQPLIDVEGLGCWPSEPDFRQLRDGAALAAEKREFESHNDNRGVRRKTIRVVEDFDFVVLGVSIGEIPRVCREILAMDERWRAMVQKVKTVATQSFQIWLQPDLQETGWLGRSVTLSGISHPFKTWADMSQVIPYEHWQRRPGSLAYFCGVISDAAAGADNIAASRDTVRREAIRFVRMRINNLWPLATSSSGEFRWDWLVDPATDQDPRAPKRSGEARFDTQFWTANVYPSDRYVLSLPGSGKFRISPLDRTYDNLTIAGDWTECGFNVGCVEAAVMSGRLAAHAISLFPRLEDIIGYDHP